MLWFLFSSFCGLAGLLSVLVYVVNVGRQLLLREQNLRERYGARWALVTGGSSGIGFSIVEKLAAQSINVVMVALDDATLTAAHERISKRYPALEFRRCGADLSRADGSYMTAIEAATADVDVRLLFNNAGFITTGNFADVALARSLGNFECNATCTLRITHHFVNAMLDRPPPPRGVRRGLVTFTSSSAMFLPNPHASLYASSKAFVSAFAASLAPELKEDLVDVVAIHPSPIASAFYANAGKMSVLQKVAKIAAAPDVIPERLFACAGRAVVVDQGVITIAMKLVMKVLDYNALADLFPFVAPLSGDYKAIYKPRHGNNASSSSKKKKST